MSKVTVRQLADVVGTPVDRLLEQLKEAGLAINDPDASVSEEEKMQLLEHLRQAHGKAAGEGRKITLRRKTTSEIKVSGNQGRAKTVNVEVRRKRTYVKRPSEAEQQPEVEATPPPAAPEAPEMPAAEKAPEPKAEPVAKEEPVAVEPAPEPEAAPEPAPEPKPAARKSKTAQMAEMLEKERKAREEAQRKAEEERKAAAEEAQRKAEAEKARREAEAEKARVEKAAAAEPAAAKEKAGGRGKSRKTRERGEPTLYGREELHVATDKSGRRRKKPKRAVTPAAVAVSSPRRGPADVPMQQNINACSPLQGDSPRPIRRGNQPARCPLRSVREAGGIEPGPVFSRTRCGAPLRNGQTAGGTPTPPSDMDRASAARLVNSDAAHAAAVAPAPRAA
ncbi:MAG: translation initiation factor IF-2 associated domain-containing protein, partial [Acidihalobacter sp.]